MANDLVITITGNLTRDPELRQAGQSQVANFAIASTPRQFDKATNDWKDGETIFMDCAAWGEIGQNVAHSLRKGMAVIAQGALKSRTYQTNEGANRTVLELRVESIGPDLRRATAAVTKNQPQGQQAAQQYAGAPAQTAYGQPPQQQGYPQGYPQQGQPYNTGFVPPYAGGSQVPPPPGQYGDDTPF